MLASSIRRIGIRTEEEGNVIVLCCIINDKHHLKWGNGHNQLRAMYARTHTH